MGMGIGLVCGREWEWEWEYCHGNGNDVFFSIRKKSPLLVTPNVSRELTSFLTQQHAVTDEEEN